MKRDCRRENVIENNTVNNNDFAYVYKFFGHDTSSPMRNSNNNVLICKILESSQRGSTWTEFEGNLIWVTFRL